MQHIYSREEWGAQYPRVKQTLGSELSKVFVHTFAVEYHKTSLEDSFAHLRSVEKFHVTDRGWRMIGYSWIIDTQGRIFEGRGAKVIGGHTQGHNSTAYGIGLFGHGDKQAITPQQIQSLKELIFHLANAGLIAKSFKVFGHRDVSKKSCPGNLIYPLVSSGELSYASLSSNFSQTPAPTPAPAPVPTPEPAQLPVDADLKASVIKYGLVYLGRYLPQGDVDWWAGEHFSKGIPGGIAQLANTDEAKSIQSNSDWLTRLSNSVLIPGEFNFEFILSQMNANRMSRAQVVDGVLGVGVLKTINSSQSAEFININDIAAQLAERLLS